MLWTPQQQQHDTLHDALHHHRWLLVDTTAVPSAYAIPLPPASANTFNHNNHADGTTMALTDTLPLPFAHTTAMLLLPLVGVLLITPFLVYATYHDYRAFLALGAGGTPHNFGGYLRIKFLSLFRLANPRVPAPLPSDLRPSGYLDAAKLPSRRGPRPDVRGIAPHRQVSDRMGAADGGGAIFEEMLARMRRMAGPDAGNGLVEGTSCFEKHGTGLFSTRPLTPTCRGEVCHIHASDGSLHLTLYPGDAKVVIERGWGERHPLARGGWLTRFVPQHFLMVYAPRDEHEMDVVERIIKASVWWVSGVSVGGASIDGRARSEADEKAVGVARDQESHRDGVAKQMEGFCLGCRRKLDVDSYSAFGS
ncbi:hypothetical protein BC567DRAFT_212422 [Phyllosticta citribraziliensis]